MTAIVGGLRHRLVANSFRYAIDQVLRECGWYDPGRQHLPINTTVGAHPTTEPEPLNTILTVTRGVACVEVEVGSSLCQDQFAVDLVFYAQSDALGVQILDDLREAMRGRLGSAFQVSGSFPIYDFRMATPTPFAYAQVVAASVNRHMSIATADYARHVHTLECILHDTYYAGSGQSADPGDTVIDDDGVVLIDEHHNVLIYE